MYNGPGADILAVTGISALGALTYVVGGWVLIVAGLALITLSYRSSKKKEWKK